LAPVTYVALLFIFVTVALLGGLRVTSESHAFMFLPPSLITLILAVLLLLLFTSITHSNNQIAKSA